MSSGVGCPSSSVLASATLCTTSRFLQAAQKLVIDLNFPGQMTEPEMRSMCSQLMYSYGANKRAVQPCQLYFTSLQVTLGDLGLHIFGS